jgi:hypothetical protein
MLAGAYCPEIVTRACIIGAESGSADAAYRAPSSTCTEHDANYRNENEKDDEEDGEPADEDNGEPEDDDDEPAEEREGIPAPLVTAVWMAYFIRRRRR